jgi:predicted permease
VLTRRSYVTYLEAVWRDVRYARRVLLGSPAFTATALLTLAVAIGINTAVFALVDAVLLRPLPYPHPDRLGLLSLTFKRNGQITTNTAVNGRTWELVRDYAPSIDKAPFSGWTSGVNLVLRGSDGAEQPRFVQQQRVGTGFFGVLGVPPLIGREFTPDEDRPGGPAAVVLSAGLWRTALASDPNAVGRAITLRGEPYTIVGIMPDGFRTGAPADLWTPLRPSTTGEGGGTNYHVVLGLRDGVPREQAIGELAAVGAELQRRRPPGSEGDVSLSLIGLQEGLTADIRPTLLILWLSVAVVFVAACVNLAGLMLTRAARRRHEMATRLALGSGRSAVVRQLLVEAAVLGIAGGVAGLAVAAIAARGLEAVSKDTFDVWQTVSMGPRETFVAMLLSLAGSVIFGLGPAVQASRQPTRSNLLVSGGRSVAGAASHWPRRLLVVTQVALAVVLLVGSGLLLRTYSHLRGLNPGFDPSGVVTASVSLEDARYQIAANVSQLMEGTIERIRREPGITSAAVGLGLPYQRLLNMPFRRVDGPEAANPRNQITNATYVSGGFFETMRIPLRRGRTFDSRDRRDAPPVVVVNDAMVREHFHSSADVDPIGRRLQLAGADREIVGIVGDVQTRPGWGDAGPLTTAPLAYLPIGQVDDGFVRLVHVWFMPALIVRSSLPSDQVAATIRRSVEAVDPLLPLALVRSMSEVQELALNEQRLLTSLLLVLAGASLVVAVIGIHGLIAASVTERTREMGIRLALGATGRQALGTLALPGVVLAGTGVVAGVAGSIAALPLVRHFVWGVSVSDPATYAGVSVLLLTVAAAASVVPALRILRLDPAITLRQE